MYIPDTSSTYQIIIGDNLALSGTILEAGTLIVFFILFFLAIVVFIWKRLNENNRMKYEFVTIIAHKFRTPLTYVKWVCDDMTKEETDSFKKQNLENIKKSNQNLIDLTGTLIEIADSESSGASTYVYKKIVLCDIVKNVFNNLRDSFHEKNIFFEFECIDDKIMVKADQARLEFVLNTLLENACNYTPTGKNVKVTVTGKLFDAAISVEDTGIGISKQDLPHVFSKFFRGKNARINDTEGFGVGLYLASSIIKHLHGKIRAESAGENLGSKFTMTLPRVR